jgi:hypothetical protein
MHANCVPSAGVSFVRCALLAHNGSGCNAPIDTQSVQASEVGNTYSAHRGLSTPPGSPPRAPVEEFISTQAVPVSTKAKSGSGALPTAGGGAAHSRGSSWLRGRKEKDKGAMM